MEDLYYEVDSTNGTDGTNDTMWMPDVSERGLGTLVLASLYMCPADLRAS